MAASFDDRDGLIWQDGQLIDWRLAQIHILTHALHYASAVFEGTRIYGGNIFKNREHIERLKNSADILGFELPYSLAEIEAATDQVINANNIVDGYIRTIAWRGPETMGVAPGATKIHLAIASWTWPSYFSAEAAAKGLRLSQSKWRRPAPDTAPTQAKASGLYMICTMSKADAEARGFDDALMLDYRGQVAEATGANIFFVKDGTIHTPIADCFLSGITRKTVLELARLHQIPVIERAIWPGELPSFQQAFLTGTAVEVAPIGQIDNNKYEIGTITKTIAQAYKDLVRLRRN